MKKNIKNFNQFINENEEEIPFFEYSIDADIDIGKLAGSLVYPEKQRIENTEDRVIVNVLVVAPTRIFIFVPSYQISPSEPPDGLIVAVTCVAATTAVIVVEATV